MKLIATIITLGFIFWALWLNPITAAITTITLTALMIHATIKAIKWLND